MPELVQGSETDALDDRELVRQALSRLPVRQREVLMLRYYEDLTEAEIASRLGCAPGTVKSSAARALRALRDTLPEYAERRMMDDGIGELGGADGAGPLWSMQPGRPVWLRRPVQPVRLSGAGDDDLASAPPERAAALHRRRHCVPLRPGVRVRRSRRPLANCL